MFDHLNVALDILYKGKMHDVVHLLGLKKSLVNHVVPEIEFPLIN